MSDNVDSFWTILAFAHKKNMQELSWYIRRLRSMSPGEMVLRVRSSCRDQLDGLLLARRQRSRPTTSFCVGGAAGAAAAGFHLPAVASVKPGTALPCGNWQEELIAGADAAAGHRLSFFNVKEQFLGDPIDWNRDHVAEVSTPRIFASAIDYRDFAVVGDCKNVWEPSRHHQLVTLGRAYRATGRREYAVEAAAQLASWLDQCPYGVGMQWRSGLELGIRLINWVWAWELIAPAGVLDEALSGRLLDSVDRHLWEIARKYSYGSSANNHLVGEAAGVYVGSRYFAMLRRSGRLGASAKARLIKQIAAQTYEDGGDKEQAIGYHLFVAQFFLIAGLVGRWSGDEFPPAYWQRLEKMFEFLAAMGQGGKNLPMFGDGDDGYVLDLGGGANDWRGWLAAAAALFNRPDFAAVAGGPSQTAWWLLGDVSVAAAPQPALASRAFEQTGYYLLQSGAGGVQASAVFDCGPLGFEPLAGHGHADALSLVLRLNGQDVLVDPGTYDYFTYPAWREYFRSTAAHNTIEIDHQSQSVMQGLFLWGQKARVRCVSWNPSARGGEVAGQHEGYTRLSDPVGHRRIVSLDGGAGSLQIRDDLACKSSHEAAIWFHFGERCHLVSHSGSSLLIEVDGLRLELVMDKQLEIQTFHGSQAPLAGWVSRRYHLIEPSLGVVGRCRVAGMRTFTTVLRWSPPGGTRTDG
jgi:hypothetical protein